MFFHESRIPCITSLSPRVAFFEAGRAGLKGLQQDLNLTHLHADLWL